MVNAEAAEDPKEMGMEQLLICETLKSIGAHLDGASLGASETNSGETEGRRLWASAVGSEAPAAGLFNDKCPPAAELLIQ